MVLSKTVAEVNLNAISHNLEVVRKKTGNKFILAVVKADAYGHGLVKVSKHLLKNGTSMLGVAFANEAIMLREAGIKAPILVFFEYNNTEAYLKHSLRPVVFDFKSAAAISAKAYKYNRKIPIHIKVDTGMGRVGMRIENALPEILKIADLKNLQPEGLMSHFPYADMTDKDSASAQLKSFINLAKSLKDKNINFKFLHIANSAAILQFPEAHLSMVRPGIMLYGYGSGKRNNLKPALSLKSKIIFLKNVPGGTPISYERTFITKRKSAIATIPIGYADGYGRKLSNSGEVLISGKRAPVLGRVCMDVIMVDVTGIPYVKEGADVILIGSQGKEKITAQDIADKMGSIPYEVLTNIGKRVKIIYRY
ncbi:MAG: alanine racemase [Thermodesulfovibrionia bacterium]